MSIMHISVPLIGIKEEKIALGMALQLAADVKASVYSSFLRPAYTLSAMEKRFAHMERYDYYGYAHAVADFRNAFLRHEAESEKSVQENFATYTTELLKQYPHLQHVKTHWREDHVIATTQDDYFNRLALLSDVLIISNALRNDAYYENSLTHFLLSSARPVIVVPHNIQITPLAEAEIVIAWETNASTIRALTMTMPFLKHAKAVQLAPFGTMSGPVALEEIQQFLIDHGVRAKILLPKEGNDTPEGLFLKTAEARNPAMIIMGGYAHSRLRDLVLGSSTEFMLENAKVPLCLVH